MYEMITYYFRTKTMNVMIGHIVQLTDEMMMFEMDFDCYIVVMTGSNNKKL